MRSKKVLIYVLPLVLLVSACLPQPTLRSELFLDDRSLVTFDPCGAPCWEDIIPGRSSWEASLEWVRSDERFANVEVNEQNEFVEVVWQKAGSEQFCCRLVGNAEQDTVEFLFLALSPQTVVAEVLEEYGDPTYVVAQPFTDAEVVVQLLYPDIPMVIWVLVGDAQSSLLANSEVVALLYMTMEQMDLIIQTNELQGWEGYQPFTAYQEAPPVVTPAITLTPVPEE